MSVAAYIRVSSKSQTHEMQEAAIRRAALARVDQVQHWYADTMTGGKMQRPELNRLRGDVRLGVVRRLYVFRLDRLTRSGIRDTLDLLAEFRRYGCELVTLADGFDMAGPAAEVVLSVLAWAAQAERLAIGERISAARSRVEQSGGNWGRPKRLNAEQLERLREMHDDGRSAREIAMAMHVPRSTVRRALSELGQKPTPEVFDRRPLKKAEPR